MRRVVATEQTEVDGECVTAALGFVLECCHDNGRFRFRSFEFRTFEFVSDLDIRI